MYRSPYLRIQGNVINLPDKRVTIECYTYNEEKLYGTVKDQPTVFDLEFRTLTRVVGLEKTLWATGKLPDLHDEKFDFQDNNPEDYHQRMENLRQLRKEMDFREYYKQRRDMAPIMTPKECGFINFLASGPVKSSEIDRRFNDLAGTNFKLGINPQGGKGLKFESDGDLDHYLDLLGQRGE